MVVRVSKLIWDGNEDHIPGWFTDEEGRRLAELAAGVPSTQAIVEIGSYAGRSTRWLIDSGTKALITCVDPWVGQNGHYKPDTAMDVFLRVTRGRVVALRASSKRVASQWVSPLGLVFVDARHEYDSVRQDFECWGAHVARGGWIALHDYSHAFPGAVKAIDESHDPEIWEDPEVVGSLWTARKR
jgi:predicted O-methyltransferase YrrM